MTSTRLPCRDLMIGTSPGMAATILDEHRLELVNAVATDGEKPAVAAHHAQQDQNFFSVP